MYKLLLLIACFTFSVCHAGDKDSSVTYTAPDSVRAMAFHAGVVVSNAGKSKKVMAGIEAAGVRLYLDKNGSRQSVVLRYSGSAAIVATGIDVAVRKNTISWIYPWQEGKEYDLLIISAGDSSAGFNLYSGYVFLPNEAQWKLIGSIRVDGWKRYLSNAATVAALPKKGGSAIQFSRTYFQRSNNSWKAVSSTPSALPSINPFINKDSTRQLALERNYIATLQASGKLEPVKEAEGIFYTELKAGNGTPILVTDTVTVHYKGYLLSDGTVFDQTKEKPATFPLGRLIKGWQTGLPLTTVGGTIKLIIPSAQAYSIRTRSPKIPPNSTLVFEIEVLEAKRKQ